MGFLATTCMTDVCMIDHGGNVIIQNIVCTIQMRRQSCWMLIQMTYIALKHKSTINQPKLYTRRYLNVR